MKNIFYLKTSSDSKHMKKFELEVFNSIILIKKCESKESFAFMDVENTFL